MQLVKNVVNCITLSMYLVMILQLRLNSQNASVSHKRDACGVPLYKEVYTKNAIIEKPALIFPTVSLKHQLTLLFKRKCFEESCQRWVHRPSDPEILADIYDG